MLWDLKESYPKPCKVKNHDHYISLIKISKGDQVLTTKSTHVLQPIPKLGFLCYYGDNNILNDFDLYDMNPVGKTAPGKKRLFLIVVLRCKSVRARHKSNI